MKIKLPNGDIKQVGSEASTWEQRTLEKLLLEVYKQQQRANLWKWLWRGVWVLLFLSLIAAMMGGNKDMGAMGKAHTAVIDINGTIDGTNDTATKVIEGMEAAYKVKNVKGIILRANSPGGSPVISKVAFDEIRRLKAAHKNIPVVVVMEDVCASGCYYIASAADTIYANPSSMVGSIGVISGGFGFTGLMDKLGVERRMKTAGANKGMGDPFSPETPEQNAIWQSMLTDIHKQFVDAVKLGRGKKIDDVKNPDVFSGRVYTGDQGKQVGLVDEFGSVYSVSRDVFKAPEMVNYTPKDDFSTSFGRQFGMQMKSAADTLTLPSW